MDMNIDTRFDAQYGCPDEQAGRDAGCWFDVPGDIDDFIFWGEDTLCSDK